MTYIHFSSSIDRVIKSELRYDGHVAYVEKQNFCRDHWQTAMWIWKCIVGTKGTALWCRIQIIDGFMF